MNALKTLNPYFWKHRILLFWGVLFILLSNFFAIYKVQFIGNTVNEIQKELFNTKAGSPSFFKNILINASIIVGSSILSGLFTFMMRQTIIVASRRIEYELKNKIYKHYQEISLTDYKKTTIGDLMNRLSEDVVAIRMYLGPGVMYIANLLVLVTITGIYMIKTDKEMTLWTLLPLPLLSVAIYTVSSIINKNRKLCRKANLQYPLSFKIGFSGIRVVKFFA